MYQIIPTCNWSLPAWIGGGGSINGRIECFHGGKSGLREEGATGPTPIFHHLLPVNPPYSAFGSKVTSEMTPREDWADGGIMRRLADLDHALC